MTRKLWLASAGSLFAIIVAAVIASSYAWRELNRPLDIPEGGAWLDIPPGTALARVAAQLAERELIDHPRLFAWYARYTGDATRIHAGEYLLQPELTPIGLLDRLVRGDVFLHQFTIVEGWRFAELLDVLRAHPALLVTGVEADEIMGALGKPQLHPEGQFLPETYRFARGTTDLELLRQAHGALERTLERVWNNQVDAGPLRDPYDALILASIIEKETGLASERRTIAGVFHRRLRLGMRLQTDPTVIYGIGDDFDGRLRSADLTRDTPYNTYTRSGLPPTPIALPGRAAIEAAVDPEDGDALYFVATGLPDGSHYFSATLEEHNRAVQRYLERRRALSAQ
jgi:UPF0755 protein